MSAEVQGLFAGVFALCLFARKDIEYVPFMNRDGMVGDRCIDGMNRNYPLCVDEKVDVFCFLDV